MFRVFPFPGISQETLRNVQARAKCAFRFCRKTNPLHVWARRSSAGLVTFSARGNGLSPPGRTYGP